MDTLFRDVRHAARALLRAREVTALAIVILALGIGAVTAIFSVVNKVVLHPLPYPDPDQIVFLGWRWSNGGQAYALSWRKFVFWHDHSRVFDGLATYRQYDVLLGGAERATDVSEARISADLLHVLGARPVLGRAFVSEEMQDGGPPVALLSHALWQSRFGSDPGVIGREIRLDDQPYTIVGVLPASLRLPGAGEETQVMIPLHITPRDLEDNGNNLTVIGRLKHGVPQALVESDMEAVFQQFSTAFPDVVQNDDRGALLLSFQRLFVGSLQTTLWVFLGATGFVFLLACANVTNLLLARSTARQREIAVRAALGAGRGRIVRQMMTESVLLGLAAGVLGVLVSVWSLHALLALAPSWLPGGREIVLRPLVLVFGFGMALASGIALGLASAFPTFRLDLARALNDGGRGGSQGRSQRRARDVLIAVEAGLAMVLLAGAGLLIASFIQLSAVDPGFTREGVLTARIPHAPAGYDSVARVWSFERMVLDRLRSTPGIVAAAGVSAPPLRGGMNLPITVENRPDATEGAVEWRAVSPGYFQTLGIRLLRGRDFSDADRAGGTPVMIISEAMAEHYWPGQNPIGQRVWVGRYKGQSISPALDEPPREIIGVAADVRELELDHGPGRTMFVPQAQVPPAGASLPTFVIRARRSDVAAAALREAIAQADPRMPPPELTTMDQIVAASLSQQRFSTTLMTIFAALALVLTSVGIYGVVSYAVARRVREIGVRMALGATPRDVVRLVVRQGMMPVVIGLGVGLVAALGLTRLLAGMLYGVSPRDPVALAAMAAVLVAVALLASYLPARRATRVDPLVALRGD
jgi:putative ABC transport system permease protein